jgi:hypothetical protein
MTFRVDGKRAIYNDEESRRENEMAKTNRRSGVGAKANYKNMNTKILFARYTKTVIWIISTLLESYFTFLQVRDAQIGAFVNTVSADIIWRIALVIYYLCWVFGTKFDTDIQELAYVEFSRKEKWPIEAIGVVLLLGAVAAVLCWAEGELDPENETGR